MTKDLIQCAISKFNQLDKEEQVDMNILGRRCTLYLSESRGTWYVDISIDDDRIDSTTMYRSFSTYEKAKEHYNTLKKDYKEYIVG